MAPSPQYSPRDGQDATSNPVTANILPYTKGLTGVNLHINDVTGFALSSFLPDKSEMSYKFARFSLLSSLAFFSLLVLFIRIVNLIYRRIRLLTTADSEVQGQIWARSDSIWSRLQKHLFTAPLISRTKFKPTKTLSLGAAPSRIHTLFLIFYALTNVLYCVLLDYHNQSRAALLAEVRGRTGHLAVINMIPLFLFAARNNPLITVLGISFDSFNLFHRWIGRIVVIQAIAHTFIWGTNNFDALGLQGLGDRLNTDPFLKYGLAGSIAMLIILFQSPSIIRHAFYETFLHLHQFLAVAALVAILLHVESQSLPQRPIIYYLIALWFSERAIRLFRIFWYNISCQGVTKLQVTALKGDACRLTFHTSKSWKHSPGCHIYAYIPSVSGHMSHPFSIAWYSSAFGSDEAGYTIPSAGSISSSPTLKSAESDFRTRPLKNGAQISCIVKACGGMTASLHRLASQQPTKEFTLTAFVEGPYGGVESLRSYGSVLLFAGGVGITHQLSQLKDLVDASNAGLGATRKIVLVWTIRNIEMLEWCREWLEEIVASAGTRIFGERQRIEVKILIYVTRGGPPVDEEGKEVNEPVLLTGGEVHYGRADVNEIVGRESQARIGAMSVGVCGPNHLAENVRYAARQQMGTGMKIDFWEESFTW
ncbi:hypothetical protein G7Y89_g5107 [Cudoniella acicularis]|uniref:FAD-binding FR-type domain-containing protein n=1 Tax=Cudoniella acicularis TaxID=354080 RepID=A0A8H4RPM4_9HELO|nr:hypothetical protein G7Y89_g5107 [Cudoniella acicularis]